MSVAFWETTFCSSPSIFNPRHIHLLIHRHLPARLSTTQEELTYSTKATSIPQSNIPTARSETMPYRCGTHKPRKHQVPLRRNHDRMETAFCTSTLNLQSSIHSYRRRSIKPSNRPTIYQEELTYSIKTASIPQSTIPTPASYEDKPCPTQCLTQKQRQHRSSPQHTNDPITKSKSPQSESAS
jgi:hypothetical protein